VFVWLVLGVFNFVCFSRCFFFVLPGLFKEKLTGLRFVSQTVGFQSFKYIGKRIRVGARHGWDALGYYGPEWRVPRFSV